MKVLFYVGYPLFWGKGGYTLAILETKKSLEKLGVEVQWIHHEDLEFESPRADLIHYWTRPPADQHYELAQTHGYKIALSDLVQVNVLHPHWTWPLRCMAKNGIRRLIGRSAFSTMGMGIYSAADAVFAVTPYEAEYMVTVFEAHPERTHYIPNGVEDLFLSGEIQPIPDKALLCLGTICERKNSVELALAAQKAGVPITFAGGPLRGENDPYFKQFRALIDGSTVKWLGEIQDRSRVAALLRGCAGFVLASQNEGSPLSILEAVACGRAVLVSDLPNMRVYYRDSVSYCHQPSHPAFANELARFYQRCQNGCASQFPVISWDEVGKRIFEVYQQIVRPAS